MDPLLTRLILFEADPATGGASAGGGDSDAPDPEDTAPDPEPEPESATTWMSDPDEIEYRLWLAAEQGGQAAVDRLLAQFNTDTGLPPDAVDTIELDPLADDFGNQLRGLFQREIAKIQETIREDLQAGLAPLQQRHVQEAVGEAEQRATDILASFDDLGDFDHTRARKGAEEFMDDAERRYGLSPRAAEHALRKAAEAEVAYAKKIADEAVERYKNHQATLAGQRGEPGASTVGVTTLPVATVDRPSLARKYGARAT